MFYCSADRERTRIVMPGAAWFEWDAGNVDHIAEHGVEPEEAEEALRDPHRRRLPLDSSEGELRWSAIGMTSAGRVLFVVFTVRDRAIRVVTAYDGTETEKRQYRRQRRRR
jgi:uncharacterized protein